jgi:hypothetical protein
LPNTFWSSLWSLLDTKLTKSTTFHPQTNGQTKVVNRMTVQSYACITLNIRVHGMRVFPMFNTTTTRLSIAPPTIVPFRWGWDSNPWVPLILHYLLQPHRQILLVFSLRPTKPPNSLSKFSSSTNRSMRFCRKPMLSTSSAMINIGYRTNLRWETRSGYICRNNALQGPIGSSVHFTIGPTLSPRLWVTMLLSSTLPRSLDSTDVQCGPPTTIFSTIWTPRRS